MSIISEIRVSELPTQPTAVVRGTGVAYEGLREFFDSAFAVLGAAMERGDLVPTGPAFALYRSTPPGPLDLEVGFPVAGSGVGALDGASGVVVSELPSGKYASATLRGGYELLAQAWTEFMEGVAEQGLKSGMPYWETYVTMPAPERNPAENVTELVVPVS